MKFNKWTLGLAAVGAVSMASAVRADEAKLSPLNTALSNTTISGYVDVAAQYNVGNPGNPATGINTPDFPNSNPYNKVDSFNLNAVVVSIDKPQDETPWAAGYHIDLNAGSDAINSLNLGGAPTTGEFGVRQAYLVIRTPVGNGIDWKFGAFDGITGYEGNTSWSNPNYTRSYGYAINPDTEVGMLGTYKIIDAISVQAGIANVASNGGADVGLSSKSYIGAIALTAPDSWGWFKGSSLNLQTIQGFDAGSVNHYSVNGTFSTPLAGLKVGLAYDKLQGLDVLNSATDGNIYGVYVTYQATDKLSFAARGEYVDGQNLNLFGTTPANGGNNSGKGEEVTLTVEYDLWANVLSRLEVRWDHTESGTQYGLNPGNFASDENAYMVALNLVYKF
jgi:hypothetical protein